MPQKSRSAITGNQEQPSPRVGDSTQPQLPPVLLPKLQLPRQHAYLVNRSRLYATLDAGLERKLCLISAPAGYGKTTLVGQWLAARRAQDKELRVAWFSLDAEDNDPVRFWRYLLMAGPILTGSAAALGPGEPATSPPALPSWHASMVQQDGETLLVTFLNELSQARDHGVLVLEDYHLITEPSIHDAVTALVEHLPPTVRLILVTRSDPPLPLARWRARNELAELQSADLGFTHEETLDLLQHALPFPLGEEDVRRLEARTEGWGAGIRLLVLALQRKQDSLEVERFLGSFSGSHRHFLEYFVTEVLQAQPEPVQEFLLKTSLLARLTGSLCDAVTGGENGHRLLGDLERTGLFLVPLDDTGAWYRYHALFADAVRHEARYRLETAELNDCYRRASTWYEQQGMLPEAVEAALLGAAYEQAARQIELLAGMPERHERHGLVTLQRWLEQLPPPILRASPALCFLYATALVFLSLSNQLPPKTLALVEDLLATVEKIYRAANNVPGLGDIYAFWSLLAYRQDQMARAAVLARQALDLLPEQMEYTASRIICLTITAYDERQQGNFQVARRDYLESLALAETAGNPGAKRVILHGLGELYLTKGELQQAAHYFRLEQSLAADDLTDRVKAMLGLALLAYEWNDLPGAETGARQVVEFAAQFPDEGLHAYASLLLAGSLHARGAVQAAQQLVDALLARPELVKAPHARRSVVACQCRLQLLAGEVAAARRWLSHAGQNPETLSLLVQGEEALLTAQAWRVLGEPQQALAILEHWLDVAQRLESQRLILETLLLQSVTYTALQQVQTAVELVQQALPIAYREGYRRLFLDHGPPMMGLLQKVIAGPSAEHLAAYARSLLQEFPSRAEGVLVAEGEPVLLEPLSAQELRVLRLLKAGLSRREIAEELVISINTVKTHLRHIYEKLHVSSRSGAVEAARRLDVC